MTEATSGAEAEFFDGFVSRKRRVRLTFGERLEIAEDGTRLVAWPYHEIRQLPAAEGVMRLRATNTALAQLDITDEAARREIVARCPMLAGDPLMRTASTKRIVFWSLAATASVFALIWWGAPLAADTLAPIVPDAWEKRFGDAAEGQIRHVFDGRTCTSQQGAAALDKLSARLQSASGLRIPATIEVMEMKTPNAFALPGGKVFVLSGLLDKAQSQDEVAGVLAHELGHLQHRDHMRRLIANGGVAYLFGLLFGDITGGGAIVLAGKTLLGAAYSRDAEAQADDFAAKTMATLGRPAKPMGELLVRITGTEKDSPLSILQDHPMSGDRLAKLAAADKGVSAPPVLTETEWRALKTICKADAKAEAAKPDAVRHAPGEPDPPAADAPKPSISRKPNAAK